LSESNKEKKLREIFQEISRPEISLQRIGELYLEGKNLLGKESTDREFKLSLLIFDQGAKRISKFMEK
jgi:hypothetical protein